MSAFLMQNLPAMGQQTIQGLIAVSASKAALTTFVLYTLVVFGLAVLSNRLLQSKSFLSEYFLGSRSLGVWAFALTFAATSASGGSFMGFPSKIYTHGWILALWIGSYMVVPICTMGFLGKRINQVARISGAITVPDVIRDRFRSKTLGLMAVSLIVFFMSFNLVAQFKAGSIILNTLLSEIPEFTSIAATLGQWSRKITVLGIDAAEPQYLLCLLGFGTAVVIYTTFGGFRAVVWTDVMQGIVMVCGVLIMLPLAIDQVGGMESATRSMAKQTPPVSGRVFLQPPTLNERLILKKGDWLVQGSGVPTDRSDLGKNDYQLFRLKRTQILAPLSSNNVSVSKRVKPIELIVLKITHTADKDVVLGASETFKESSAEREEFSNLNSSPELYVRSAANGDGRVIAGLELSEFEAGQIQDDQFKPQEYAHGNLQAGVYISGPGPSPTEPNGFLPLSLAISFFFMWSISGSGQPSNMVRLMAFDNTRTLRRSIFTVALYYTAIYFPLVMIFCCARVLLPGMEIESDRVFPAVAVFLTENAGIGWMAGLLMAAPFAAVMSTVDSFLLLISSALVRDIYQRNMNPNAQERTIKRLSYWFTLLIGAGAVIGAINPPQFLQDIIVYTGSGLAACFLAPVVYALYWPRINKPGVMSAMIAGFSAHLAMYIAGIFVNGSFFSAYKLFNFDPILVGLSASFLTGLLVTKFTAPPPVDLIEKYFHQNAQ